MAKYSTHPLKELLEMWEHRKLTVEQRVPLGRGHLLQHLAAQGQRITTLEAQFNQLEKRPPAQS